MNFGNLRKKFRFRKAASTSNILDSEKKDPPKEKQPLATKYGEQRQVVVGGKALKEIEVTGEKQQETFPETRRHRRISKSRRAAEFEGDELKVQCRDLNPADYEGWLFKKSTGGPLHTVTWKQCWVVLKNGILYLYKTSFDIAAQHAYSVRNFSVAPVEEKRKHTFKLVPKNVPPEALQDAKGVVFACESDADVEKWCDVLNKAALGFIIQQTSNSEKDGPIRRRCQSAAVKKEKPNLNGVPKQHRSRSTTFTGETTGLPSSFNRSGSTSRTRKVSGSGSSSVLAVGNMFLAIDEPSPSARTSSSDLTSIVYKEELDEGYKVRSHSKQQAANGTAGEDEIRMEVKKEVERINKHSKPTKPVEGKGQTIAGAKKADIIRQEIMNLKERESQKESNEEEYEARLRNEASNESEVSQDTLAVDEGEEDNGVFYDDDDDGGGGGTARVELVNGVEEKTEGDVKEALEDSVEEKGEDDVSDNEAKAELDREASSQKEETDSGISVEDYLKQMQAQEADVSVEEYIARMTESKITAESGVTLEEGDIPEVQERYDIECTEEKAKEEESCLNKTQDLSVILEKVEGEDTARNSDDEDVDGDDAGKDDEDVDRDDAGDDAGDDGDLDGKQKFEEGIEIGENEEQIEPPRGMIPAKQQRMLMDAVLSLDYPSESDSETDDADELCHYANLERPSTPNGGLRDEENEMANENDELNVIIDAPPGFENLESDGHQTYAKVREHNIQYGATQGGKPVIHHVFAKSARQKDVNEEEVEIKNEKSADDEEETLEEKTMEEETLKEDVSRAKVEEESCLESIIEEKRLEVTETDLQLDFVIKQEEEEKLEEDGKQEDHQLPLELEAKGELQQDPQEGQKEEPQPEEPQPEEHELEKRQIAEQQQAISPQEEDEEPLKELRMELLEETLKLEQLQREMENVEFDELPPVESDSKSVSNENLSIEEESLRLGLSSTQDEASDPSSIDKVHSSSHAPNTVSSTENKQESVITVNEDRKQELELPNNDEKDIVEGADDLEASKSEENQEEESDERDGTAETPTTATIKIIKVSVKQRSKETNYTIGAKAFESSV